MLIGTSNSQEKVQGGMNECSHEAPTYWPNAILRDYKILRRYSEIEIA
jgi:hypothetical protein